MHTKCCDKLELPFANSARMEIAYSVNMRERFGNVPHVKVYHEQPDGSYIEPLVMVTVNGNPASTITVDNGGVASGFIKIFK